MRVIDHVTCPLRSDYPEKSLFVFDFDGVLINQIEDVIARAPETEGERDQLIVLANHLGIHADLFETPYLRHLVFQGMAKDPCPPHVIHDFIKTLEGTRDPFMILTARSGKHAISRLIDYLDAHDLHPQEMFCVGRAAKTTQLQFLLDRFKDHHVCYFEDSKKHVELAAQLDDERLIITHVDWTGNEPDATQELESLRLSAVYMGAYGCDV